MVHQVHQALQVLDGTSGSVVLQEQTELQEQMVLQEQMAHQVAQVHQVLQV
jgi:hypothetical protein